MRRDQKSTAVYQTKDCQTKVYQTKDYQTKDCQTKDCQTKDCQTKRVQTAEQGLQRCVLEEGGIVFPSPLSTPCSAGWQSIQKSDRQ